MLQVHQRAAEMLTLLPGVPAEVAQALQTLDSPVQPSDVIAGLLHIEPADKQQHRSPATFCAEADQARCLADVAIERQYARPS